MEASREAAREYLLEFLKDEFKDIPVARIRILPSPRLDGVSLKTESREYFFPTEWMERLNWPEINGLVGKVRSGLGI